MRLLREIARKFWRSVSETAFVWIHELNTAFRDEAVLVFMVVVPLGYPLLYSYIYNNELVRDIPVAVVDESQSSLSRQYARSIDASQYTRVVAHPDNLGSAKEMMRRSEIYGIVHIPSDFSLRINSGQQASVQVFSDVSSLLYYRQISIANTDASLSMNAKIKVARAQNTTDRQDRLTAAPVEYEEVDIFNSTTGMATFLLPAVLMVILQQTLLLGVGINAGTMREKNMFRLFRPIARHAGGVFEIVLGRSLCYIPVHIANSFYILGIVPLMFGFNRMAHFPDLLAFMVPYLLAVAFMAQVVSHFVRTRESSMMVIMFSSLIFLFISGISWPWAAEPVFWKAVGCLVPSTLGINGFIRMTNEGARLSQVSFEYIGLWIQAAFYLILAMAVMRSDIRKSCADFNRQRRKSRRKRPENPAIPPEI